MKTVTIKGRPVNLFDTAYDVILARRDYYGKELGYEICDLLEHTHFTLKDFNLNKPFIVCPFTYLDMVRDNPVYMEYNGKLYTLIGDEALYNDLKEETAEENVSKNYIIVNCEPAYSLFIRDSDCDDPREYSYFEYGIYETKKDAELASREALNTLISEEFELNSIFTKDELIFEKIHEKIMEFVRNTGISIKDSCHVFGIILQMFCEEITKMPESMPRERSLQKALDVMDARIMATDFELVDIK